MEMMKTITPTINALASSLCLNLGLTKAAEKLDPIASHADQAQSALSGGPCMPSAPCAYTPRNRR